MSNIYPVFSRLKRLSLIEATLNITFIFFLLKRFFLKSGLKGFYMFQIVIMSGLTRFWMVPRGFAWLGVVRRGWAWLRMVFCSCTCLHIVSEVLCGCT